MRANERRYYDLRAPEYDDWYLGRGRFAGIERPGWDQELEQLVEVLCRLPPGRILDVACGTGFLTRYLPGEVTALDQSEAMLAVARTRSPASFVQADAFELPFEAGSFNCLFTAHFYGHLRDGDHGRFLAEARRVAHEIVVVDAALRPGVEPEEIQERGLKDGSWHEVYKRYFTPEGLAEELGGGRTLLAGDWFVVVAA